MKPVEALRRRKPEHIVARYVIGCDGAASTVRGLVGIPLVHRGRDQHLIAADGSLRWALPADRVSVFVEDSGFAMVLPMGRDLRTRFLLSAGGQGEAPDADAFVALVERRTKAPLTCETCLPIVNSVPSQTQSTKYPTNRIKRVWPSIFLVVTVSHC